VDEVVASIASAVGQQDAATREIAHNVTEAAAGSNEVTRNILEVSAAAKSTGNMAETMSLMAMALEKEGSNLGTQVETFLANVKAI
jgi:methyl-accepting chemotaxis protein